MTHDQLGACIKLEEEGFRSVLIPVDGPFDNAPVPGIVLMIDAAETKLLVVQPDGTAIDLLAVLAAAEDTVRNWHKGSPFPKLPQFVGDFGRLTKLAIALNGRKVDQPAPPPPEGTRS